MFQDNDLDFPDQEEDVVSSLVEQTKNLRDEIKFLRAENELIRAENSRLKALLEKHSQPIDRMGGRYWSPIEHRKFLEGVDKVFQLKSSLEFGKSNHQAISEYVGTKTKIQVHTHAQKYFMKHGYSNALKP